MIGQKKGMAHRKRAWRSKKRTWRSSMLKGPRGNTYDSHDSHSRCVGISTYQNGRKTTSFLASNWDFFGGNWEKGGYFGLGMGPNIGAW